ncbi:MAG: bifunctional DNA-formamidopyrimidine glycosylase/DNA-(apurinic or apyrimidinic site) lyase [Gammaproteobacteria bacterium]|nr:bifunctional DNA-formamidopyrimidine glycosylase/DNA-(apurinic or apyrimidinic site) lyase [Gammaproteobacteria bacterium]
MPELPEVETTRAGIVPHVVGRRVAQVVVRNRNLRWPIPTTLARQLTGQTVNSIRRRGKYLIIDTEAGHALIHLGMSGSLRIVTADEAVKKHDHVDLVLDDGRALRFHDPRRFGCLLWTRKDPLSHDLLASLGPEPLGVEFSGDYLHQKSRGRRSAVKGFIMDSHIVVGVGNIYASEALFRAGIHPKRAAGRISRQRYQALAHSIVEVLTEAIEQGGTTLRDFVNSEGNPGYFQQTLNVYGRESEACPQCGHAIMNIVLGQRSTYYCAQCQT